MQLKGRGGIKGSARCLYNQMNKFPYVARFDVASYYGSINHNILFELMNKLQIARPLMQIIKEYVRVPDTEYKGTGIVSGGALSTLLGAAYLSPLDAVMHKLYKKGDNFYLRYQDDIVILAKTRWKLKTAIKKMYGILESLKLNVHTEEKRFIGKTYRGFSFLGYFFKKRRKLRPSKESLKRFVRRTGQLIELGCDNNRILSYIERYFSYLQAGLNGHVSRRLMHKIMMLFVFKVRKKPTG